MHVANLLLKSEEVPLQLQQVSCCSVVKLLLRCCLQWGRQFGNHTIYIHMRYMQKIFHQTKYMWRSFMKNINDHLIFHSKFISFSCCEWIKIYHQSMLDIVGNWKISKTWLDARQRWSWDAKRMRISLWADYGINEKCAEYIFCWNSKICFDCWIGILQRQVGFGNWIVLRYVFKLNREKIIETICYTEYRKEK